jgi:hypothetical protein
MRIQIRPFIPVLLLCGCLTACQAAPDARYGSPNQMATPADGQTAGAQALAQSGARADESQVLAAQQNQQKKVEVTIKARVFKMLPDDTKGLPHERFLLRLSNGTTVLVAHDTKLAPRLPLQNGDEVTIHGEYIWNPKGGVIHWTHHTPDGRHEPGWIDFKGQRYQ